MKRNSLIGTISGMILFIFLLNCALGNKITETIEKTFDISDNGTLTLKNVNGSVKIRVGESNKIHLYAVKSVRAGNDRDAERLLEALKIDIQQSSDKIEIETIHPRRNNRNSTFWDLFSSRSNAQYGVDYELEVPEEISLDIRTTNGSVHIANVQGELMARSTNGKITLSEVAGNIIAKTTNGSINSSMVSFPDNTQLDLGTTNGQITLELPISINAYLSARTTNGRISTDFPIQTRGEYSGRRIEGTIGDGGGKIDLRTTNGNITITER